MTHLKHLICGLLICLTAFTTQAQTNNSCELQMDEVGKTQWEYCSTWLPCKIAFKAISACGDAQKFLERLKGGFQNKLASLFGKPKPLDAETVYEAAVPEPDGPFKSYWSEKRAKIRETVKRGSQEVFETSGGVWVGDLVNNKKEGPGTLFMNDGRAIRGTFVNNVAYGLAENFNLNSKSHIVANYDNNDPQGELLIKVANGNQYLGEMSGKKITGQGKFAYTDGQMIEGQLEDGEINGYGTKTFADGSKMSGTFLKGKPNGDMTFLKDGVSKNYAYVNGVQSIVEQPAIATVEANGAQGDSGAGTALNILGAILQGVIDVRASRQGAQVAAQTSQPQMSQLQQQQRSPAPAPSAGKSATAASGPADCQPAIDRLDAEIAAKGTPSSSAGAVASYQFVMYATSQLMQVLDRSCKGQPQYATYGRYKQAYDTARQSCIQSAIDSSSCVPRSR